MSIPDEFYLYLAQKGYTNICRGHSLAGGNTGYVVPTVQIDTCQRTNNELYFFASYPIIKSRFDPHNQDLRFVGLMDRDPTFTIDKIFEQTGGEMMFQKHFDYYSQGTFDPNAKVLGMDSISSKYLSERYVTDTNIESAQRFNMWVNESGVFKMDDIPIPIIEAHSGPITSHGVTYIPAKLSSSFTNHLMGCLVKGVGYENIEFALNGSISCMLKDAGIVKDAVSNFYKENKGKKKDLKTYSNQITGDKIGNNPRAIALRGMPHPETLIGSGFITVSQYSESEILVRVFDIKSIYSGDLVKETKKAAPFIKAIFFSRDNRIKESDLERLLDSGRPISLVRDSTKSDNRYTNTSQTYLFTLPIEFERLETGE